MKFTQSSVIFWLKFWSIDKGMVIFNVFVDCAVLGWLKPTKLCKMVKIMSQFVIMLFLGNDNIVFVGCCVSIRACFQSFCTNDREILQTTGFRCWTEQIKLTVWIWNKDARSYTRFMIGLSWKILVLHENYAIKYNFLSQILKYWKLQVIC